MKLAGVAASVLLVGGLTGFGVGTVASSHHRVGCVSVATQIPVNEGMPADYDFQLCGAGVDSQGMSCPQLPEPGRSVTCTVTPRKPGK